MKKSGLQFSGSIDWFLLIPTIVLAVISVLFIYSSGNIVGSTTIKTEYIKQIVWIVFGIILFVLLTLLKYDFLKEISLYIFLVLLALVILTIFFSKVGRTGGKLWLDIGEFGIQPSEFLKVATILLAAKYVDRFADKIKKLRYFIIVSLLFMAPAALVLIQPDLGTSLVFIPAMLLMLFIAGARAKHLMYIITLVVLTGIFTLLPAWDEYINTSKIALLNVFRDKSLIIIVSSILAVLILIAFIGIRYIKTDVSQTVFYWILFFCSIILLSYLFSIVINKVLAPYQMKRLLVFMDPNVDSTSGYHVINSIIAVGSGGFSGKGFLLGTQSHLQYLPEQSTDFIFSIISEELGFLGPLLIFASYGTIFVRIYFIIKNSKDTFAATVAAGVAAVFLFHLLINIGMTIGIMPVTGIPLLLLSYGGSSIIASFIALGIVSSISSNRYNF